MAREHYLHLDLLVEPAGSGAYSARVLDSPVGRTDGLPILLPSPDDWEIGQEFGAALFDAVFRDRIRDTFDASVRDAWRSHTGLRLRLRTGAWPEVDVLPWELLHDARVPDFLVLSERTPVVRYVRAPAGFEPLAVELPLRILAVGPLGRRSGEEDPAWERLQEALDDLRRGRRVRLDRAVGRTVPAVLDELDRGSYHVLHLLGRHDSDPGSELSDGRWLALLGDRRNVGMVFLGTRAVIPGGGVPRGPATPEDLVTQGIPAVVALQWEISDGAVGALARHLYEGLAEGQPVDVALARGRRSLHRWDGRPEWASPALYTSAPNGLIFDIPGTGPAAPPVFRARPPVFGAEPLPLMDEDVQFSMYRPRTVTVGQWASLLVYAHKSDPIVDPVRGVVDPLEEVRVGVERHFGATPTRATRVDAPIGLARGTALRVVPDVPGATVNPPAAEFRWQEEVHEAAFRFRPEAGLQGWVLRGLVRIWCGPIIVAELPMAVPVLPASVEATASRAAPVPEPAVRRYRKIFPSYSRRDGEMVQYFVTAAHALGDQYLQDVLSVRPGERWNDRLLELIEEADVFQLFWSYNSMRSPYCRLEWERALALRRPSFVRPVYWEDPLPADPQAGLPPEELRALQFAHVPHFVTRELARPEPPVYGAPAARPSAGRPPAGATPAQDAPRPEAPRYELPGAAASRVEAPRLEVPRLEAPRVEAPRAGSSRRSLRLALVLLLLLAISAAVVLYVRSR